MMKRFQCILGMMLLALSPAWAGKLYKWTDENGNVYYSDKLPPETVEKEHHELNERGVTTKSVNREKTEEERQQETAAKALAEAEKRRVAEEEARVRARDQLLLNTFTTERDLLLARQDRLDSIDSLINLTESNNLRLEQQVAETRQRMENIKNAGREVPENVSKQLENLEGQLTKNRNFILVKREERSKLEQQFDGDLKRYRELKGVTETATEQRAAEEATQAAIGADPKLPVPPQPAAKP